MNKNGKAFPQKTLAGDEPAGESLPGEKLSGEKLQKVLAQTGFGSRRMMEE